MPGSGKSTFYKKLQEVVGNLGPEWKVSSVSSDEIRKAEAEKMMSRDKKLSFAVAFEKCG
jgi:nucleoside-triphosphatase THEP1